MNELQLPPAPPLPAEVRERVLRTVLAETGAPRRRFAPLVAAAVVVATTLAVTTSLALTGTGAEHPAAPAPSGLPAPTGDTAVSEALARCAAAVAGSEARGAYPPPAEWRVTDVLQVTGDEPGELSVLGREPGIALAIDDSFACHAGQYYVFVSSIDGVPAGSVEVAQLTGVDLVLLNPQRVQVDVDPGSGSITSSTAAVQLVHVGPDATAGPSRPLVVHGSYHGPLPEPGDVAILVQDRPLPEPPPLPDPPPDNPPPPGQVLETCLYKELRMMERSGRAPRETVLSQDARGDLPRALVGHVNGTWAAFCYDDPNGPVAAGGGLAPARMSETRIITSHRRDGLVTALMTVAPDVERVEIATVSPQGSVGPGMPCTLQNGFALCMLRADGDVDVRTIGGRLGTVLRVP
jgi:hypothetical protein